MKDISIQLNNSKTEALIRTLLRKEIDTLVAAREGVKFATDITFDIAQSRAPEQSGALKASGHTVAANTSSEIKGVIGYGTSLTNDKGERTADYAVTRHEMPSTTQSPESHKWLEQTILDMGEEAFISELREVIAQALRV